MQDQSAIYERIRARLVYLYGETAGSETYQQLRQRLATASASGADQLALSERDVMLITYGDQVRRDGEKPLSTLHDVLRRTLAPTVNSVHILPFFPYSSDDGFSVIDYRQVDPALGDWQDVRALHQDFKLMFDAVFNHMSAQSDWFQAFLRGEAPYSDYFVTADPNADLSAVVRPRALPLLTPFETASGTQHVWTTFSDDQVDLNARNPAVLLDLIDILLFYVDQGADFIRLDAIAFLWKEIGTTCIHLEPTHEIIRLMRDVLDLVQPSTIIITETNVPHEENISYFGDGSNEAQMVYQFPLPPLILHTFRTGNAAALTRWGRTIQRVSARTSFFNFAASHDGIGLRPVTGILTDAEINALIELAQAHGGHVSYKTNSDGSQSAYELNISYFDAITDPRQTAQNPMLAVQRFICSQAIMLAFIGVPGIYFHSLFGSRNDPAGVAHTGRYRSINREKLDADRLLAALRDPLSLRSRVFDAYMALLKIRTQEAAFHPLGDQRVLDLSPQVFAVERSAPDGAERILALHNVGGTPVAVDLPSGRWRDLQTGGDVQTVARLAPYQVCWLKK